MVVPEGREPMLTSPRGKANNPRRTAGFTLIELLVVVSILSILSVGAGLVAGGGLAQNSDSPAKIADRFSQAVLRAHETAILGRDAVGLRPRADGWALLRRDPDGVWQTLSAPEVIPRGVISWRIDGRSYAPRLASLRAGVTPPVVFMPDGRSSALSMVIGDLHCDVDGAGGVSCR